jgi:hypothetical protein
MSQQITLDLPESIIEQAKAIAEKEGRSIKSLLAELIENGLSAGTVTHTVLFPTETPYGNEDAAEMMQKMIQASALPKVIKKP